ncbi:hypothetical protein Ancab_030393 [Ancistrocladus abbreviatus]
MTALRAHDSDYSDYVEVDPTGRYGRYNEILGKGSSKTVYRAFDEYEGIEVAWNQVKLADFLQKFEDLERICSEIHLLKTLEHKNIVKFYTSWVDTANRNINFVTEMFTSGTLRQYRLKHKKVNTRAVKHWCRQILEGLLYLHSHNPRVIHRDLKCDNIFINGNQGEVKIGDLGLAAILRKSYTAHCVGTPEFMAPEVYAEEYNELVDIYSFGMCVLEMVTFEYPYSECSHPAQIYKKVMTGKKPDALYKVKDPEVRQFVEKCLATVSCRLPASELLKDPFLQIDDNGHRLRPINFDGDFQEMVPLAQMPLYEANQCNGSLTDGHPDHVGYDADHDLEYQQSEFGAIEFDLFTSLEDDYLTNADISIKGRKRGDGDIFLRLRIADIEGCIRNIYFPFDIETDTALSVATEMVSELDITDQEVTKIAEMIDGEIVSLVPSWKRGLSIEEALENTNADCCKNCVCNSYLSDYVSSDNPRSHNLQVLHYSENGCPGSYGRFEEITYQVEGNEQSAKEDTPAASSSQFDGIQYTDIWAQHDGPDSRSQQSKSVHFHGACESFNQRHESMETVGISPVTPNNFLTSTLTDDHENEIRKELRWLKAKYQMQLREIRDQQLGLELKPPISTPRRYSNGPKKDKHAPSSSLETELGKNGLKSSACFASDAGEGKCTNSEAQQFRTYATPNRSYDGDQLGMMRGFCTEALIPHSLHSATSLPVDAVDC